MKIYLKKVLIVIPLIVVSFYYCGEKNKESLKKVNEISIRLNWIPDPTFTGIYVETYGNIVKEKGFKLKVKPGGYNLDPISLVVAGEDQIGIESAGRVISAILKKGYPLKVIFAEFQKNPVGWVVMKNSGITTPQDFIGKKMGEKFGTEAEVITEALFSLLKIDVRKLNRIPVQFSIQPFLDGQVDIFPCYMNEEPIRIKKKGYDIRVIDPSDYGLKMYGNVIFVREDFLKKHRKLLKDFVKGLKDAWKFAIDNPNKAYSILLENMPEMDVNSGKDVMIKTFEFVTYKVGKEKIGYIERERWIETVNIIVKYNKKVKGFKMDKNKAYNGFENLLYEGVE